MAEDPRSKTDFKGSSKQVLAIKNYDFQGRNPSQEPRDRREI